MADEVTNPIPTNEVWNQYIAVWKYPLLAATGDQQWPTLVPVCFTQYNTMQIYRMGVAP